MLNFSIQIFLDRETSKSEIVTPSGHFLRMHAQNFDVNGLLKSSIRMFFLNPETLKSKILTGTLAVFLDPKPPNRRF